jgi:hypothetical protein
MSAALASDASTPTRVERYYGSERQPLQDHMTEAVQLQPRCG